MPRSSSSKGRRHHKATKPSARWMADSEADPSPPLLPENNGIFSLCANDACEQPAGRPCATCHNVAYCSRQCQHRHWKASHRHECGQYQRLRTPSPRYHRSSSSSVCNMRGKSLDEVARLLQNPYARHYSHEGHRCHLCEEGR